MLKADIAIMNDLKFPVPGSKYFLERFRMIGTGVLRRVFKQILPNQSWIKVKLTYWWKRSKQNKNAAGLQSDKHNIGCGNPEYYLELFIDDFIILERYSNFILACISTLAVEEKVS